MEAERSIKTAVAKTFNEKRPVKGLSFNRKNYNKYFLYSAFVLLFLVSFQLIFSSAVYTVKFLLGKDKEYLKDIFNLSKFIFFALSTLNFIIFFDLVKKKRYAYLLELFSLFLLICLRIIRHGILGKYLVPIYLYIFIVLYLNNGYFTVNVVGFKRKSFIRSLLATLTIIFTQSIILVVFTSKRFNLHLPIEEILKNAFYGIFGISTLDIYLPKNIFLRYQSTIWLQLIFALIVFLAIALKPIFEKSYNTNIDDVKSFIIENGKNPLSYLILEEDKNIFYSERVRGLVGYKIVNGVFVILGDIVVEEGGENIFIEELLEFCKYQKLEILFLNSTGEYKKELLSLGLHQAKYGEDCIFTLDEYDLKGKRAQKIRTAINKSKKLGVEVHEYKIEEGRDEFIENSFREITDAWIKNKGSMMMEFTVGSMNLEAPENRRYFYSIMEGVIIAFVVFVPYDNRKGYIADITRRREEAPQGAIESIIYDGFMTLKEEGAEEGNMGLCPLYNVVDDFSGFNEKFLNEIYERFSKFYNFKALRHSKEKYGPTTWKNRYLYYSGKNFFKILTAIVLCHFPKNMWKYVSTQILDFVKDKISTERSTKDDLQ